LTPHIAGLTVQANERVSSLIAQRVLQLWPRERSWFAAGCQ
jgi:phosphoglycerate dehydrogenase-like enzyme